MFTVKKPVQIHLHTICAHPPLILQRIRALVIGINDYKHYRSLKNAVCDARAVKGLLECAGLEVCYVVNANILQLREEVDKYIQSVQKDDVTLIYFAGRGCEYNNATRLLAKSMGAESDLSTDSIDVLVLLDRFV